MTQQELKLFLHLCESRHFGKTAKAMFVSASTLSRKIQHIEEKLGHSLFIRDNRTVELTQEGEEVRRFAQNSYNSYQLLQQTLIQKNKILSGELRLFCSVTASYSHLPAILDRFRTLYPGVEIKLVTGDAAEALQRIKNQDVDLAIAGYPRNLPTSITFYQLDEIPLVMISPASSCAIAEQISQPIPDWTNIPFILPTQGPSRDSINLWLKQHDLLNPTIYATVSGHEAIVSMVALECGIALIPEVVLTTTPESIRNRIKVLHPSQQCYSLSLGVFTQRKRLKEPLVEAFWKVL